MAVCAGETAEVGGGVAGAAVFGGGGEAVEVLVLGKKKGGEEADHMLHSLGEEDEVVILCWVVVWRE